MGIIKRQLIQTHKSQISTAIKKVMVRRPHNAKLKELRLFQLPPFPLHFIVSLIQFVQFKCSLTQLVSFSLFISFIHSINHALTGSLVSHIYFIYTMYFLWVYQRHFNLAKCRILLSIVSSTLLYYALSIILLLHFICVCVCVEFLYSHSASLCMNCIYRHGKYNEYS